MSHRIDRPRSGRVIPGIAAAALLLATSALSPGCGDKDVAFQSHEPITAPPPGPPSYDSIGAPCTIYEDEGGTTFAGYKVTQDIIASESSECHPRVCLVNHFQGRVGCPLGQDVPVSCAGPTDGSCKGEQICLAGEKAGPLCDSTAADGGGSQCASGECNQGRDTCACTTDAQCPDGAACDPHARQCAHFVCHEPGACQLSDATDAQNQGKSCCGVLTFAPVTVAVCGKCEQGSGRSAKEAAYCSCRCGPADGEPADDFNYCACPEGFECTQIHPDVGLGAPGPASKYCIKQGTAYTDQSQCGTVNGHFDPSCAGTPGMP